MGMDQRAEKAARGMYLPTRPLTAFFYTAARDVAPLTDGLRIGEARNELSASIR
jgi:hypothetical protein